MQAPAKGTKRRSISYAKWGYIFIAPFFIAFAIFQLIPLASTIYYSFFEYYRSGLKVIGPNCSVWICPSIWATPCSSGFSALRRRSPFRCCWPSGLRITACASAASRSSKP